MEITVKHEFTMSPELASFFSRIMAPIHTDMTTPAKKAPAKDVKPVEEVKAIEEVAEPVVATETSSVSLEMVRAAVSAKATAGKREEVKSLLTSFGAANVTTLESVKYAEFLTAVNAL